MPGLYIHVPFCRKKCLYCDFVSFDCTNDYAGYVAALLQEMRLLSPMMEDRYFDTVFIGGGTPSILNENSIRIIVNELRNCFKISDDCEFTIESNPESLTLQKLRTYCELGINRLSIGLQSGDDVVLKNIGRVHNREQFEKAIASARVAGFGEINVDLMHGLPGQSMDSYLDSIKLAVDSGCTHISSYSLILEEHTPMFALWKDGEIILPTEDETADMEDAGFDLLEEFGFNRYEISNFAKSGHECKHNINYWQNGEYLGIGLNSHSAMHLHGKWLRWANKAELSDYVLSVANGKLPVETTEEVDRESEMFETIMVGLRMTEGVNRRKFFERFGIDPVENFASAVSAEQLNGNLIVTDDRMALTKRGMDFLNEVLLSF